MKGANMGNYQFEELMLKYKEKNIIKLSKKLSKSFSLSKSKDVTVLCELAYWLYIYGYEDEILDIYSLVNIELPIKVNFDIWTWILSIWGLQAYIYEQNGEVIKKDIIVEKIKEVYSQPKREKETKQEAWEFFQRIANRQTFEEICNKRKIESCILENDKKLELGYRLSALYNMISYGVTGFYSDLEANKEKLKEEINDYIGKLK